MDKFAISGFVGWYLEKNLTVTPTALNHFIAKSENVGKPISDTEIVETLNQMVTFGWLEVEKSDPINPVYRRYVSEEDKRKFRNGKH